MDVNREKENQLLHSRLLEVLRYDKETGVFTWKVSKGGKAAGSLAGSVDPSSGGYRSISIDGKGFGAHRLAWFYVTKKWPINQIDHEDHIPDNNAWVNLRCSTQQENAQNCSLRKNNTSGVTGVLWVKARNTWKAEIGSDKHYEYLGNFHTFKEAVKVRKEAEIKLNYHENHGV